MDIIKQITDISNSLDDAGKKDFASDLDMIAQEIITTCSKAQKWKRFASKDLNLLLAHNLETNYYNLFKISKQLSDIKLYKESRQITIIAQGFWGNVKDVARGVTTLRPLTRMFQGGFEDMQQSDIFNQTNSFIKVTLSAFYRELDQQVGDVVEASFVANIQNNVADLINFLISKGQSLNDPSHPSFYFTEYMVKTLQQFSTSSNKEEMKTQINDLVNEMKTAEIEAAGAFEKAKENWMARNQDWKQIQSPYQLMRDRGLLRGRPNPQKSRY